MVSRLRSPVVLLALVACVCSASAPVIGTQAPARQPSVTTDVVYGHKVIRIKGAGHWFEGAAPADLERAYAAMMQWFEQRLGSAAK